jgi:hypothetical protein
MSIGSRISNDEGDTSRGKEVPEGRVIEVQIPEVPVPEAPTAGIPAGISRTETTIEVLTE